MQMAMEFPETFDEFVDSYGFIDTEEVYTNGSQLIPVFRVKQWLEHISEKTQMIDKSNFAEEQYKTDLQSAYDCGYNKALSENKGDLISRQAVINAIANTCFWLSADNWEELTKCINSIPSVENKGEFEGMTNGDVIISLYPNLKYVIRTGRVITTIGVASSFDLEWWNAPYKAESEDK